MNEPTAPGDDAGKPEEPTAIQLAAETLGRDMLDALVQEFDRMPEAWPRMAHHLQEQTIRRLEVTVRNLVTNALAILLKGDFPACRAVVESVQFKDGIKAVMKVARTEHSRYELAEHVGTPVVVVLHDPAQYFERMETVRSQKGQAEMFSGPADPNEAVQRMDREEPNDKPLGDEPPPDAADLELERDPLWKQASQILDRIGIVVEDASARAWSIDECTEAAFWANLVLEKGRRAPPPPAFIVPHLPEGWKPKKG